MTYIPIIRTARIDNDAVTGAKVLDGTLTNADINAAAGIVYSKLNLANSIVSADIVNGTIVAADTTISLAQLAAQTASAGDITASSQKITNLADGTNPNDAVNYGQLTAVANGIVDWKNSVRAVSTSNITLSGPQTIDGVSVIAGDRVLVAGQTTGADNGIYVAAAGAWSRSTDADASSEVTAGMAVPVEEGTNYNDTVWLLSTNNPITLGTTALTFVQLPTLNDLIAGAGLTKTGNTLDVGAGTGITVNANDVAIDTSVVPRLGVTNAFTGANSFAGVTTMTGGLVVTPESTKTGAYSVNFATDQVVPVDTTGGAVTISLPATPTNGQTVTIVDVGGAGYTNNITVDTLGSETLSGAASQVIEENYGSRTVTVIGGNYYFI